MLTENMLCKHFKGQDIYDKIIYRILKTNVTGASVDWANVIYSGDNDAELSSDLVIYQNIIDGKIFAREYADLISVLSEEKQVTYKQTHRVEPLSEEEINIVNQKEFIKTRKKHY